MFRLTYSYRRLRLWYSSNPLVRLRVLVARIPPQRHQDTKPHEDTSFLLKAGVRVQNNRQSWLRLQRLPKCAA